MPKTDKMICPLCGVEMNHHCDKLVYATESPDSGQRSSMGGIIEEFHACPHCGSAASRHDLG